MKYLQAHILNLNNRIQDGLDRGDRLTLILTADKSMYLKLEPTK